MAYLFADGFDNYADSTQLYEQTQLANGGIVYGSASARFPAPAGLTGQGIKVNQNSFARKNLPVNSSATITAGFAWFCSQLNSGTGDAIIDFEDAGTVQLTLGVNSAGALVAYNGALGTNLRGTSSPGLIAPSIFYFIEVVVVFSTSATGSVNVYLNGSATASFSVSSIITAASANAFANQVKLIRSNAGGFALYDDLYVLDSSGSFLTSKLGDSRIITKMPSGAGALTNWTTLVGAATHWQAVNEIPPNEDTSYVADGAGTADQDSYAMQSASLTANPNFVVVRNRWRKDDAGVHTAKALVRSGGVVGLGAAVTIPSTYIFSDTLFENDPNTTAHWLAAAADSTEVGQEETT